ncbi:hypothetical protein C6P40_002981 [Pichia californica]|uniref:LYC1 C-terminal domain-containing protein n=1 Tax=Pichia californica TaxID=460514 RepID=A0A9P7BCK6_9ASCO|nr:hypothetical protein C6P42_005191 [[Candida] californica]KAG0687032.1 hypothetical protein C6P40_002981 [[Candida] californica]
MVLELTSTTSKKDLQECQSNNFISWGAPLTIEQYYHRDSINYESNFMNLYRLNTENTNGGIYFILKDNEIKNGEIESACEIFIRDSWIAKNGELFNCKSAVIGSVYTAEKFRGKGNANFMMKELIKQMKEKYLKGKYDSAFLYSEIGEYYSKFGYKSFNVEVLQFDISNNNNIKINIDYPFETIYFDYKEISNDYFNKMKDLVLKKSKQDNGLHFMLKPSHKIFEWFANRSRVNYWAIKHPEIKDPPPGIENERNNNIKVNPLLNTITGFEIKDKAGKLNYISFYPQFHNNDCYILAMHATEEEDAIKLIKLVLNQCIKWGMKKVSGWKTDICDFDNTGSYENSFQEILKSHGLVFTLQEKNDSLSAIQLMHQPDNIDVSGWEGNGKWCWF